MKDNDNSVIMNAGKSNYNNAKDLRSVSVVLRKMRFSNALDHAENAGFMAKNIVFYKIVASRTRGIAKILYGMNFCYYANETLIHAHHFLKTLLPKMPAGQLEVGVIPNDRKDTLRSQGVHGGVHEYLLGEHPTK